MKPGKTRLARRAQHDRLMAAGRSLEVTARIFSREVNGSCDVHSIASKRIALYEAAIKFAAMVDGEDAGSQ